MNRLYFTAVRDGAGLAAEFAVMLGPDGAEPHVYIVEPTGDFEDDPNVTDKKFPGNPRALLSDERTVGCGRRGHRLDATRVPRRSRRGRGRLMALREGDAEIIN